MSALDKGSTRVLIDELDRWLLMHGHAGVVPPTASSFDDYGQPLEAWVEDGDPKTHNPETGEPA